MAYMALYRKWRPGGFDELVGQEHVSRTLSNAINTGKVGHASRSSSSPLLAV